MNELCLVCVLCHFILSAESQFDTIKVLRSTLSLKDYGDAVSGAKLVPPQDKANNVTAESLTLCIRFNFKLLGTYEGRSRLITIEDWRQDEQDSNFQLMWFGAMFPFSFFGFGYPREHGSYKSWVLYDPLSNDFEIWASNRWTHVCFSYDKRTSFVRVVKDGRAMNLNNVDLSVKDVQIPGDFLSKVYLARCSFDYKGTCSSPEGQISDFNVWDRALKLSELEDWTTCRSMEKGNLVDWNEAEFDLVNMTTEIFPPSHVCVPPRPGDVLFPERRNLSAQFALCHRLRGRPSVVDNHEKQKSMIADFLDHPEACGDPNNPANGMFFAGWWDEPKEGVFSNANNNSIKLTPDLFQPWYYGEPNGDVLENCVVVWPARDLWNDFNCNVEICSFCELEKSPDLQMRGLCYGSKFDNKFSWTTQLVNGRHSFRGYSDSFIFWDVELQKWKMTSYLDPTVHATVNQSEYPLGVHVWDFFGESCYENYQEEVVINLHACEDSEFNCNDGYCVSISGRCDGKTDCPDKTDEIGCEIFTMDASYLPDVPPSNNKDDGSLLDVGVSVDILSILEIAEVDSFISLQLRLRLSWRDSRLTMLNLKEDEDLNTLTSKFRELIWIPEVIFYNTKKKEVSLNDQKAFATIHRNGSYTTSPRHQLQNAWIFRGGHNPITISRVYDSEFICEFNMAVYPFDSQKCSVIFIASGNSGKFIKLVQSNLKYLGPIDLTQYFVKHVEMFDHHVPPGRTPAIRIEIAFGRRILAPILTTYLPTILLCLVSFSTNYFKPFFFEAVVTVNLTTLLVLTTLFISVSNSLPKTSYIKMIDIWLIFNLFVPFSEVLLHTYIDSFREELDREINHHGSPIKVSAVNGGDKPRPSLSRIDSGEEGIVAVETATKRRLRKANSITMRDLVGRVEKDELQARKFYYENQLKVTDKDRMNCAVTIASKGLPLLFLAFIIGYFAVGMSYYFASND